MSRCITLNHVLPLTLRLHMSTSIKITKRFVDQAEAPTDKNQTFFWDSTATGFGLRVTEAGSKSDLRPNPLPA